MIAMAMMTDMSDVTVEPARDAMFDFQFSI